MRNKVKKLERQRQAFIIDQKDLESNAWSQTLHHEAEMPHKLDNRVDFRVNPIYHSKDIGEQLAEIRGNFKHLPRNHQWHTPLYKELLENVVPLRTQFR